MGIDYIPEIYHPTEDLLSFFNQNYLFTDRKGHDITQFYYQNYNYNKNVGQCTFWPVLFTLTF